MGFFRRRIGRPADPRPVIAEFWRWWAEHRGEIVDALREGRSAEVERLIAPAVASIDHRLRGEVSNSAAKPFGIVVSSAGVPDLRATAERWRVAAPDDPDVEFFATRRRDAETLGSMVVTVDDFEFAMNEMVAGVRANASTGQVHVVMHHPLFPLIDHDHRLHVAFIGLDSALGEDGVQRWIGSIDVSADVPIDAIKLGALTDVVDQLRAPGGGEWAAMEGRGPKGPVFAIIRRAASPQTHPLADTHVAVVLGYDTSGNGMPTDEAITADVERLEAEVLAAFGGDGPHAVHVGHITGGGQVVAHFYIDGLEVQVDAAQPVLGSWNRGKATIATSHDPEWEHVAPFMG